MTTEPEQKPTAMRLAKGVWVEGDDPLNRAWNDDFNADLKDVLRGLGYSAWSNHGDPEKGRGFNIAVFSSDTGEVPQFLIMVEGSLGASIYNVYATTVPDVMQILAQWEPLTRSTSVVSPREEESLATAISGIEGSLDSINDTLVHLREYGMTPIADRLETIGERLD